jgi:hypothetical protein
MIQGIFKELGVDSILKRQLTAAVYDSYIVLTMPRGVVRGHKRFIFLTCGMRSAYNLSTIETTVQYFMKWLVYFVDSKHSLKDILLEKGKEDSAIKEVFENYEEWKDHEILLALIQFYLVSEIEQEGGNNDINSMKGTNMPHAVYNHVRLKLFWLDLLTDLFKKISIEYECLKELMYVLDKLSFITIVEMNGSIIKLCRVILERISNSKSSEKTQSVILPEGDTDVSEARQMEKELNIIALVSQISQRVTSHLQSHVYQDINLGELKIKLKDNSYEGIESMFIDSSEENKSSNLKLTQVKDSFELLKACLTTMVEMKVYWTNKDYLNKISDQISEKISLSFDSTIFRYASYIPLNMSNFAKYYFTNLSQLLDDIWKTDITHLSLQFNKLIIRLLSIIKVCNSVNSSQESAKEKEQENSPESGCEQIEAKPFSLSPKKVESLKAAILYMIQLLNKSVVNSCSKIPLESIKDSFAFFVGCLFSPKSENSFGDGIVDVRQMMLKGINGMFIAAARDQDMKDRISHFSKYLFEESMVFVFSNVQKIFKNPQITEQQGENLVLTVNEAIKFVSNTYVFSTAEQKEILIDSVVKLILGIVIGVQENKVQRTKHILSIINATGDGLYNVIMKSDQNLAKGYISSSLNENQKHILQNLIKAIATKKAQEENEQKNKATPAGNQRQTNVKARENQQKLKLGNKFGT